MFNTTEKFICHFIMGEKTTHPPAQFSDKNNNLDSISSDNLFDLVKHQYRQAITESKVDISPEVVTILSKPMNEIIVNFPVTLSDGTLEVFKGYRVQHNNLLGPFKGGIRFFKDVTLDECNALAFWMTMKAALYDLPYGGGKGGVKFNPRDYQSADLKKITQAYIKAIYPYIGPNMDIPAPDLGTNSKIIDWMMEAYQTYTGNTHDYSAFTGKSVSCRGSQGRTAATGLGVVICLQEWATVNNFKFHGTNYILQGFGNVGSNVATFLSQLGSSLIGVGDHTCYLHHQEGFNIYRLQEYVDQKGNLKGYPLGKEITKEQFFAIPCQIIVPAALELQINAEIAATIQATVVVEAANGPIDQAAEQVLLQNNIAVIPDILANSGGIVVSYYEWLQNLRHEYWSEEEVFNRLRHKVKQVFNRVWRATQDGNLRRTCYQQAVTRIDTFYQQLH